VGAGLHRVQLEKALQSLKERSHRRHRDLPNSPGRRVKVRRSPHALPSLCCAWALTQPHRGRGNRCLLAPTPPCVRVHTRRFGGQG
jgi:hypothetical protein